MRVPRFMRDPVWQFIGAAIAIVALVLTGVSLYLQRPVKQIQVIMLSNVSLVDVQPEAAKDIEVYYKGKLARNIALVEFQLKNSGNQTVMQADYSQPILFSFAPDFEIVDINILKSEPSDIGLSIMKTDTNQAQVVPVLLNAGDSVTARFIVINTSSSDQPANLQVSGRIAGVKNIELVTTQKQATGFDRTIVVITAFVGSLVAVSSMWIRAQLEGRKLPGFSVLLATYGAGDIRHNVTKTLNNKIKDDKLHFFVTNDFFGGIDPTPGVEKDLRVTYQSKGKVVTQTFKEKQGVELPLTDKEPGP